MASNVPPPPPPITPQAPAPQYAPPAAPPAKKKTSPWVWVLLGCLGVIVLGLVIAVVGTIFVAKKVKGFAEDAQKNPVITGVEMMARFDKDIDVVSKDRDNDTITIRNKKTGETITLNAENFKDGHISWKSDKGEGGEVTFDAKGEGGEGSLKIRTDKGEMSFGTGTRVEQPDWVPSYPGSSPTGTASASTQDEEGGSFTFKTADTVSDVLDFYKEKLKGEGFEVSSSSWEKDGSTAGGGVNATSGNRSVTVAIGSEDSETTVHVVFRLKK